METKMIDNIKVSYKELEDIMDVIFKQRVEQAARLLLGKDSILLNEIGKLIDNRWITMKNKKVFYDNETVSLFPKLNLYQGEYVYASSINEIEVELLNFSGYRGDVITYKEAKKTFNKEFSFPNKHNSSEVKTKTVTSSILIIRTEGNSLKGYDIGTGKTDTSWGGPSGLLIPIFRLNGRDSGTVNNYQVIFKWLEHDLVPEGLSKEAEDLYEELINLYKFDYVRYEDDSLTLNEDDIYEDILSGNFFTSEIAGNSFLISETVDEVKVGKQRLTIGPKLIYNRLLNCEKTRADIESYDEKLIKDPNRGHWDLWETSTTEQGTVSVYLKEELIARNPRYDIKQGGVIGIDFGTKSTVVVHQEDSDHTLPMRVGMGHFSKKVEAKHYENPTVMEFINIANFLEKYRAQNGRPLTSWEDLTISHTAFHSLMESSSEHFYSIISDLKQWAGVKNRQIRIKDKAGHDVVLPSFLDITDEDMNPIELYAYYIGLYINNQHNGIYLDYTLSFPVTYEKEIREKILASFEKGLKKSLPTSLLEDEEIMSKFRVSSGASEPAAYAICALQEYGFEPEDDEKIFYGVFDFGGGTTDFDFGIWREANIKERRYDYVIEHFEAGGDIYLGGENLLELLAFEVLKKNQDKLREAGITFILPPECQRFAGSEILLSNSQEAKLNMKQLMEKLRPLWERHEGYEKDFEKGIIRTNLFDKSGKAHSNFELEVNQEELEEILLNRIDKGIRNFFDSLRRSFENPAARDAEKVHILLAGNSSKSQIVKDLFQSYIEDENKNLQNHFSAQSNYFEIFPPLGTEEAYVKLEARGVQVERENIMKPNGKTGVAFGIVQSRKGGKIKVINHNIVQDEAKFSYYLGMSKKGKFKVIVDRADDYHKWHLFIDAAEEDFEIYYTSLPEASRNQLPIQEVQRKKIRIDQTNEEAFVFIRTVSPNTIEYVTATEEGIVNRELLTEIKQLKLN